MRERALLRTHRTGHRTRTHPRRPLQASSQVLVVELGSTGMRGGCSYAEAGEDKNGYYPTGCCHWVTFR